MAEQLVIKQGTTRAVIIKGIRDAAGDLLDPTGWGIHGVARPGVWAAQAAVWRDTPGQGELAAVVVDADPALDPAALPGEKWIELRIDPGDSDAWSWRVADLDVELQEPGTSRQEAFSAQLALVPAVVRTA